MKKRAIFLFGALSCACAGQDIPNNPFEAAPLDPHQTERRRAYRGRKTTEPVKKKRPPPSLHAKELASPAACDREVRRIAVEERDHAGAWSLSQACIAQHKFHDLDTLLDGPLADLRRRLGPQESALLISRVIADRGANFAVDVPKARQSGLQLLQLATAIEERHKARGRYVVLRGLVAEVVSDRGKILVEIDETSRKFKDRIGYRRVTQYRRSSSGREYQVTRRKWGRIGSDQFTAETGRLVTATLRTGPTPQRRAPNLLTNKEYVFVLRFERAKDPQDATDETEHGFGTLVAFFEPGVELAELSR